MEPEQEEAAMKLSLYSGYCTVKGGVNGEGDFVGAVWVREYSRTVRGQGCHGEEVESPSGGFVGYLRQVLSTFGALVTVLKRCQPL